MPEKNLCIWRIDGFECRMVETFKDMKNCFRWIGKTNQSMSNPQYERICKFCLSGQIASSLSQLNLKKKDDYDKYMV